MLTDQDQIEGDLLKLVQVRDDLKYGSSGKNIQKDNSNIEEVNWQIM